jgi:UDP-glucose 4-epimerase
MSVCLVTGGAGFIGSHLVEALLARGHVVRVLDNFSSGRLDHLSSVLGRLELFAGDLGDFRFVQKATRGVEVVFHQAMPALPPHQAPDPAGVRSAALGTVHLLSAALAARVRRVVYASSLRVYGPTAGLPLDETAPLQPCDLYAFAKAAGEQVCTTFTRVCGLETVRLRYFNVFGPRQPPATPYSVVIARTVEALLAGRSPVLDGDGQTAQDFIYVDDAVHATLLAAEVPRVSGKVYNVARGRPVTARAVAAAVNAALSTRIEPVFSAPRPAVEFDNLGNTLRAEADLGFCAATDLEQGLRRYVAFHAGRREETPAARAHANGTVTA